MNLKNSRAMSLSRNRDPVSEYNPHSLLSAVSWRSYLLFLNHLNKNRIICIFDIGLTNYWPLQSVHKHTEPVDCNLSR